VTLAVPLREGRGKTQDMTINDALRRTVDHFNAWRGQGLGDLETMLAGIRYRIRSRGAKLNPTARPPGYRSENLRQQLREMGATKTTLWGPTAIRGDLAADKKGHIIEFLELVNEIPAHLLEEAFNRCARIYVEKTREEHPPITLPAASTIQKRLFTGLRSGGKGKIQQGLVYSVLEVERRLTAAGYEVSTKRTHAGDWQSGEKGDVRITKAETVQAIYEIKALPLSQAEKERVLGTHGAHDYPLFILAPGFDPADIKDEVNSLENTFALNLEDFIITKLSDIIVSASIHPDDLLTHILKIYNEVFCTELENDPSIRITLE
jgi:hypothetical protein